MMQKAVVSACASALPDATACCYLLRISATASISPLKENLVMPCDSGFAGSDTEFGGFIYFYIFLYFFT